MSHFLSYAEMKFDKAVSLENIFDTSYAFEVDLKYSEKTKKVPLNFLMFVQRRKKPIAQ